MCVCYYSKCIYLLCERLWLNVLNVGVGDVCVLILFGEEYIVVDVELICLGVMVCVEFFFEIV